MKHRIGLTVTDPNHPMVSKRKETIQKTVRVSGEDREKAINSAIAHYKRKGYKVHDHHYIGTVNEEIMSVADTYKKLAVKHLKDASRKDSTDKQRNYARTMNKRALEAMKMKDHTAALNHYRGVKETVKEAKSTSGAYEKSEENKRSADAAKKQGDMFAHHLHMADYHDNLAQWHSEEGRHNISDIHAEKSEKHHEQAMKLKEEVDLKEYGDRGYGGAYVNGRSDDAIMTARLTRHAKAAAKKAGKTFNTSAEYRVWHAKQQEKQAKKSVKEEQEQLDELSPETQHSYFKQRYAQEPNRMNRPKKTRQAMDRVVNNALRRNRLELPKGVDPSEGGKYTADSVEYNQDSIIEADTFPVGHDGQTAKSHVKSVRSTAETKAKSIANQAVNKSKADAMKEEFKVGQRVTSSAPGTAGHAGIVTKVGDDGNHEVHFALHGKKMVNKDHLSDDSVEFKGNVYDRSPKKQNEAWNLGNRNPQKGIKVGHKVRSYDFPGMHDDHYIEGHVVGETPHSYHIRVNKVVRSGKEIPTPAHMTNVEAPKGKGMLSNAYGVHKIMAKQDAASAAPEAPKGGAKTFANIRGKK